MNPYQYQQQQQLQYQQQYGQQQVQFVPAYTYNIQAQPNQPTAASGQYGGGTFSTLQQPVMGVYSTVAPEAQYGQSPGNPQVYTPAIVGQTQVNQSYQTFAGAYQLVPQQQQIQPATNLQPNDANGKTSVTTSSSASFVPPPMNFPSINIASNSGGQLEDINQKYTEQYQKWQQQYNEWQAQHANHPDQKLFQEYQKQVQQWQQQQQQQMIQAQGMSYGIQSQTLQATQNQTGQPSTSQAIQNASVNVSSQQTVSHSTQLPSTQYQSSSQFSNQSQKSIRMDNQTNKTSLANSSKYEGGKESSHWQQNQQHKQQGWSNRNTSARPNQTSPASAGNPRPEVKKENQGGPKWLQQNQQQKQQGWSNQNTNAQYNQTSPASAGNQRPEVKKGNQGGPKWLQQNQQQKQHSWSNENTSVQNNQTSPASAGIQKPELKKGNQGGPKWLQQNQQQRQHSWSNQNTSVQNNQTSPASTGNQRSEGNQGGPKWLQQNQQQKQQDWSDQNANAQYNQTSLASAGNQRPEAKKGNQGGPKWLQQNQHQTQQGFSNQNTSAQYDQISQASAVNTRPEIRKENNLQGVPKWLQQNQGKPKPDLSKDSNVQSSLKQDKLSQSLPKWMQAEGNKIQPQNKSTENETPTPKWLQAESKIPVSDQESKTPLPKWLQDSKKVTEQQGLQENINKPQIEQVSGTGKEQVEQKQTVKDTKPLPKWLQDTKTTTLQPSTTTEAVSTKQTESSQAQKTTLTTSAVSTTTSAFSGLLVQKLDPKEELELLQKQSIQLLQLAQLEKQHKESKSEATGPVSQKPVKTEPKPVTSITRTEPTPSDNLISQRSSGNQQTTQASSEHPLQSVKQEGVVDLSTQGNLKGNLKKPQVSTASKLKSVPCRFFPKCRYGAECKFRHPPCTIGKSCTSKDCIFDHTDLPDEVPGDDLKVGSFGSLGAKDVQIPGIGDTSHYVETTPATEERHQSILSESTLKDSTPVESKPYVPPKQDEMGRYPEERRGGEPDGWRDDEWQKWRNERERDYAERDERLIPPRDEPPANWSDRQRAYPNTREEWEKSERQRPWRESWERPPDWSSERDRPHPSRDEQYARWYEEERWKRPQDDWDYPPYRQDPSRPPLSPRYQRDSELDRPRYPPREIRERPYYDREYKNEPPYPRLDDYDQLDRYRRPLSPRPEEYDRRKEWEDRDRDRDYYWSQSRESDWRDRRDPPTSDLPSDRYREDYGRHRRGVSPPVDPSRPPMYDRPRYRDYPPEYDRKDAYWDRRDYDRGGQDMRDDPGWRRNPDDVRYHDHHSTREQAKPVQHEKPRAVVVPVETILDKPGRDSRPDRIVIILRGLPGSGKTHVARLVKDKEASNGAHAPRIISLDDYFLTEVEKQEKDPDTGKRVKKKVTEYLYEAEMEDTYRASMFKSFSKTLEDGFFPVVMVDAINNKVEHFEKYWSLAKQKGFEVYIAELSADSHVCAKRNSHNRTYEEISKIQSDWEESPTHMLRLDVRSLLQDAVITEVEMETADENTSSSPTKELVIKSETNEDSAEGEEEQGFKSRIQLPQKSKWDDMDSSAEAQLNKLDGIRPLKRKREASPPLSTLSDDEDPYDEKEEDMRIGKKRVRWADIEERKHMEHRRRIGFCIGTDWSLLTDPNAKIPEH